jgi:hypothetical protein
MSLFMRKKIGWLLSGLSVLAGMICACSIVASDPPITGENIDAVAAKAPAMFVNAMSCGMFGIVGGLVSLWVCGIFSGKNSK